VLYHLAYQSFELIFHRRTLRNERLSFCGWPV
jgi:hypothetical protein